MSSSKFESEMVRLNPKKANMQDDIPTKILIKTSDIVAPYLSRFYNKAISEKTYPNAMKKADVIPIHKKEERTLTKNYRPISLTNCI